jgi:lysophospholipase L1-like esterase
MLIFFKKFLFAFKESINSYPELYPLETPKDKNLEEAVDEYLKNYEKMDKISVKNNAKYINFLQPCIYGGNRQPTSFDIASTSHTKRIKSKDGKTQAEIIFNFFSTLNTKIKSYKSIINLQNIFDQIDKEIYLDHAHFSDLGHNIIAKAISEKILEIEDE